MKTRNIVLGLSLLLCAGSASAQFILDPGLPGPGYGVEAQTHFYNETRTFYGHGFVYQADVSDYGLVTLYNRDAGNFVGVHQMHRDGRLISQADRRRYPVVERATNRQMQDLAEQIVIDAFSRAERLRLNELEPWERLGFRLIICSDTGRVKEVHFRFYNDDAFATIPVSTFRRMEVEIKERVRFTPTDFGRSLNFIFAGWLIEIPRYGIPRLPSPDPDPTPDPGRPGTGIGEECPIGGIGAP